MDKTIFKCGICQKVYNNVEDRMHCEVKCIKDLKDTERRLEMKRLYDEQKARQQEVEESYRKFVNLREAYLADYGSSYLPNETLVSLVKNILF